MALTSEVIIADWFEFSFMFPSHSMQKATRCIVIVMLRSCSKNCNNKTYSSVWKRLRVHRCHRQRSLTSHSCVLLLCYCVIAGSSVVVIGVVGILLLFANSCFDIQDLADYHTCHSSMTTMEPTNQDETKHSLQYIMLGQVYSVVLLTVCRATHY